MKALPIALLGAVGLFGVGAAIAFQNSTTELPPAEGAQTAAPGRTQDAVRPVENETPRKAAPALSDAPVTPMKDRVAVIGVLNKRNGLWRDLTMKPGQALRVGDAVIHLRACEKTAPWETQQLTGAFVQLDVRGTDQKWRRVFSGWLFKESPSLNVVEHPIYDVWPKGCTMRYPDIGPDTVTAAAATRSAPRKAEGEATDAAAPAPQAPAPPVTAAGT